MFANPPLILASSSPRRLALLRQVGIEPLRIESPEVDETPLRRELPRDYARRMAELKASAIARQAAAIGSYVLGADTVVACGRRILPKADDARTAESCLRLLSGRRHRVHTGLSVSAPDSRRAGRVVTTIVRFKRLSDEEVLAYLASEEWLGKAGGYAIQGRADAFVRSLTGSYSNVVGLPLADALDLLRGLGWRPGS
ncbi:MAG: Maf family protein [Geminicoccaceae bacterium]